MCDPVLITYTGRIKLQSRNSYLWLVLLTHTDRNTQNERKATQNNAKQRTQGKQNQLACTGIPVEPSPPPANPPQHPHASGFFDILWHRRCSRRSAASMASKCAHREHPAIGCWSELFETALQHVQAIEAPHRLCSEASTPSRHTPQVPKLRRRV